MQPARLGWRPLRQSHALVGAANPYRIRGERLAKLPVIGGAEKPAGDLLLTLPAAAIVAERLERAAPPLGAAAREVVENQRVLALQVEAGQAALDPGLASASSRGGSTTPPLSAAGTVSTRSDGILERFATVRLLMRAPSRQGLRKRIAWGEFLLGMMSTPGASAESCLAANWNRI